MKEIGGRTKSFILFISGANFILILLLLYLTQCNDRKGESVVAEASVVSPTEIDTLVPYGEQSQGGSYGSFQKWNRELLEENAMLQRRLEGLSELRSITDKLSLNEVQRGDMQEIKEATILEKDNFNSDAAAKFPDAFSEFKYSDAELGVSSVLFGKKRWKKSVLKVYFVKFDRKERMDIVLKIAKWTSRQEKSDIRVSIGEKKYISSEIGTDAAKWENIGKTTMSLSYLWEFDERRRRQIVLHEFGHALGLGHTHQSRKSGIEWDVPKALKHYKEKYNLDSIETMKQVITPYESGQHYPLDKESIMIYEIPAHITRNGVSISWPDSISQRDGELVMKMYKKN